MIDFARNEQRESLSNAIEDLKSTDSADTSTRNEVKKAKVAPTNSSFDWASRMSANIPNGFQT